MTAERAWAWRITDQTRDRTRLAAGYTATDASLREWDVAKQIIEANRQARPDLGDVHVLLWTKDSLLPKGWPVPWESDRDPHGDDRAPSDVALFSYAQPPNEDPAARARADALSAALNRHDEARARISIQTGENVAAKLDAERS
ncbi:hypothetical protein [Streptomyces sp. NBC_01716]|uniref:hypothetical protein n=1 Tax=Streptomyces sp. NBC_01716 TaxID=2975917 RepID=UPI002E3660DB|nr:hypothetical protein [Streptomyces sp. NBC_01716]